MMKLKDLYNDALVSALGHPFTCYAPIHSHRKEGGMIFLFTLPSLALCTCQGFKNESESDKHGMTNISCDTVFW